MPIVLIPFSIFFVCCMAQFIFVERVKRALVERHPDVLQAVLGKSFFTANAITMFAWRRGDRDLNDPDLTTRVKQLRRLFFVAFGAWALIGLAAFSGVGSQPLPLGWLLGHAAGASSAAPAESASATASGLFPNFDAVFAAGFLGNGIYLALAWRLSTRWNALKLGPTATMGDPGAVLGVIWWSTPATYDAGFARLRLATRVVFVLALAGTLTVFALFFSAMR